MALVLWYQMLLPVFQSHYEMKTHASEQPLRLCSFESGSIVGILQPYLEDPSNRGMKFAATGT